MARMLFRITVDLCLNPFGGGKAGPLTLCGKIELTARHSSMSKH